MKSTFFAVALICGTSLAFGQSFEGAVTGGPTVLSSGSTITPSLSGVPGAGDILKLNNGWNLGFRMTLNPYKIFGYEFGYIYNRTHLLLGGADQGGMAIHDGFASGLIYATKEGSRIRPFGAAGINFSNFVQPGGSSQNGGGQNKFGINYGAGVKVKLTGRWQIRFDIRQFNTSKPDFGLHGISGRLLQTQISAGFGFAL
jgi:opacity protein-like surface antigen